MGVGLRHAEASAVRDGGFAVADIDTNTQMSDLNTIDHTPGRIHRGSNESKFDPENQNVIIQNSAGNDSTVNLRNVSINRFSNC